MYYKEYAPNKSIDTKIYKDFFTQEELSRINECINKQKQLTPGSGFYAPTVQPSLSRVHIEIIYPEDILKKMEDFASELCGEDVVLTHNSYYHYNKKYNPEMETPVLKPHRDFDNYYSKLTLDYQLEKNVDWDILIEDERYSLEFGDMLAFWGAGLVHWRENKLLDENESTSVLTLHFSNKEDHQKLNNFARTTEEREKRKLQNLEDPILQGYKKQWEEEGIRLNNKDKGV
jgi:hypothetical protein